jgi:hypothetical protein
MNYRKPVVWIITGAMAGAAASVEARENPHVEQRQYEEIPSLTHESPLSTATSTISYSLFSGDFYFPVPDSKFRIKF